MLHLTSQTPIFLATEPADFRKGLDGFIALCRLSLKCDPRSEARFVFINKNKTLIRALSYDATGFWLMTKRLSKGKFTGWPARGEAVNQISATHLCQLLKGCAPSKIPDTTAT